MADIDTKDDSALSGKGWGFFATLLDLILGRESDPQRKELQLAQKQLNKSGSRFFKLSRDRLLPSFASFLYGVYEAVDPLREFFLTNTSDKYYSQAVLRYFTSEKLDGLVEAVSKDALEERGKDREFAVLKEDARKLFDNLTTVANRDLAGKANAMFNAVSVLKQFCLIDYFALLKRFKPDLVEHRFEPGVVFGQLPKKFALDIVPDFLLAAVNLLSVEDWDSQLEFVASLPGFKEFDRKRFDDMFEKLNKMNSLAVFSNFGRLLLHDPAYTTSPQFPSEDIAKAYLDSLSHTMEETLAEIDTKKKNELLEQQMKDVFGGIDIMELQNYTAESSEVLEDLPVDLDGGKKLAYTHHAQAKYFHTFAEVYLGKKLLEFVENFAVRAELYGGEYAAKFSAEYHQMLSVNDEIMKLDMELGQGFPNGYKIATLADAAGRSHDAAEKLYTEVSNENKKFAEQLGTGMGILQGVYKKITNLLEDRKSISPAIAKNWNTIDDYLREPSLQTLTDAHTRLSHFISLMESLK